MLCKFPYGANALMADFLPPPDGAYMFHQFQHDLSATRCKNINSSLINCTKQVFKLKDVELYFGNLYTNLLQFDDISASVRETASTPFLHFSPSCDQLVVDRCSLVAVSVYCRTFGNDTQDVFQIDFFLCQRGEGFEFDASNMMHPARQG